MGAEQSDGKKRAAVKSSLKWRFYARHELLRYDLLVRRSVSLFTLEELSFSSCYLRGRFRSLRTWFINYENKG